MSDAEENPLGETEEDGETEMEEEEDPNYYAEVESMQQEPNEDDTVAWRDSQEEGEEKERKEEPVREETVDRAGAAQEEVAAEVQEETTVKPQDVTETVVSLKRLTLTDPQSVMSETSPKTHGGGESKHSLLSELSSSLSSQLELLDLELPSSKEQPMSSPESQSSGELGDDTDHVPQDELGQERRDLEPEKGETRQEKRVSYLTEEKKEGQPEADIPKDSLVSTTTEDILFQKAESASVCPLTMTWSFGWNSSLPVYYIRDANQRVLLYASAHTAVIYDVFKNSQHHLQGHPNVISCFCISEDRRWIATADKGPNCLIIIWDSFTGIPVHTMFDSCPEGNGIRAIAISRDAKYLATISDAEIQKVSIWRWTLAVETPACTLDLPKEYGFQNYLTFNPTNNKELVSNSKTQAIYYLWYEEGDILTHSAPLLTEKTFNKLVGKFSQSVFHLNLTQMLSATMEGKLVVWDVDRPPPSAPTSVGLPYIRPCKLVHLQKESITVLTTVDSYIVTGDAKGHIKFYDHTLSIIHWYSHFKLSSIRSLSFSKTPATPPTENSNYPPDCTLKGDPFVIRNLVIGTSDATVYHLTTDGTKLEKLLVEPKDAICAISCHPYQPLIAIGSFCGMIKVWDYERKKYLFSRVFEKGLGVQSLTYNPEGALLGAGFTEGTVYILDAMSLENQIPEPFKYSTTSVTHISFSHDSQYMATADVSFTVAVYKVKVKRGQRVWEYLARLRSHRKSIRSLLFGVHLDSSEPRLLSLGRDRLLIEYSLLKSYRDHLEVLDIHRTDQGSYPTFMIWYPPLIKERFLLISNSSYKVKLFNSTTKMCRKTLLGPVYGSPIEQIQILPVKTTVELQKRYLVFINTDKVGLQILPIDGNPHKTSAIICHPNGVAGLALAYDGHYAFTAGGPDRSVLQWEINLSALEAAVSLGGEDLTPFYALVSGGREGKFYRELEDYFYYSQLRSQGINTMETRKVSEHICLSELPFVMRAIGFYPSEEKLQKESHLETCINRRHISSWIHTRQHPLLNSREFGKYTKNDFPNQEIEDMFNEIRFSEYVDTGEIIDKINLPDFLKIYLNHRPPFGNTMRNIQKSFDILGYTNSKGEKVIQREDFLKLLLTKDLRTVVLGHCAESGELTGHLFPLQHPGSEVCYEEELPDEITAEIFATEILGFTISPDSRQDPTVSEVVRNV
ncbi:cilia- and flagella-associated protein 251 isoform X3 [Rhinolophus sinicus]|uniref:cilia- and flagella-associated protein 251 isoform X3 n=1 Tax=Rhinolophus sinicus TaxID=89399 RepID=UPI003D799E90